MGSSICQKTERNSGHPYFAGLLCPVDENGYKWTGLYNYSTEKCPLVPSVVKPMLASGEEKVTALLLGIHMETSVRTAI